MAKFCTFWLFIIHMYSTCHLYCLNHCVILKDNNNMWVIPSAMPHKYSYACSRRLFKQATSQPMKWEHFPANTLLGGLMLEMQLKSISFNCLSRQYLLDTCWVGVLDDVDNLKSCSIFGKGRHVCSIGLWYIYQNRRLVLIRT